MNTNRVALRPAAVLLSLVLGSLGAAPLAAQSLTVTPITWNVIGLDSNRPASGPQHFPVGARVCSSVATTDVLVSFVWDSANPLINLRPGSPSTIEFASIDAGSCVDAYFEVELTRVASAFDTTRRYRITATDSSGTSSTPAPRELYVEYLISQNRNSITDVRFGSDPGSLTSVPAGGAMNLVVGNTYTVQLVGGTATQGYNQFEAFINFPSTIFQILDVSTTYSANNSPYVPNPNDKLYADACLWQNDPNSPAYLSCVGGDFKAGGNNVVTTYTIRVISGGGTSQTLNTLLYDFSGSSFHYNADYSTGARIANLIDPATAGIGKSFSPNPASVGGVTTLSITLTNPNAGALSGYSFTDSLPAGMTIANPSGASTTGCGTPSLTAVAGSSTISFSGGTVAANGSCLIRVNVTPAVTGDLDNTTGNLFIDEMDTGSNASATLTVTNDPPPGTGLCNLTLARWAFPSGFSLTSPAATTANVTASAAAGAGIVPQASTNSSTTSDGTTSWGTNGGVASGAVLVTANDDYFEFAIDTTGYTSVFLTFDARRVNPNSPLGLAVYSGTSNTRPEAGTLAFSNATALSANTTWNTFGAGDTIALSGAGLNASGTTYVRIYGFNAVNSNPGSDLHIDNVRFTGCGQGVKPTISKTFSPDTVAVNGVSTLTFTLSNTNGTPLTGAAFTDSLPSGVQVAASPSAATTCAGSPSWAPTAGATVLEFGQSAGGTIPANGSCTVSVNVIATTTGPKTNISGVLSTTETGTTTTSVATATLTALTPPSIDKQFAPNPILPGETSRLTFTITNLNQDDSISGVSFTDSLPGTMTVASVPAASTSGCGTPVFAPSAGAGSITLANAVIEGGSVCVVAVNVTAPSQGTYSNTSGNISHIVNSQTVNGNVASDELEVLPPSPGVGLLKEVATSSSGPWRSFIPLAGGSVHYRFTVENTGDVPLSQLTIADDTLDVSPCNASFAGVVLPVAVAANDEHIVTCITGPVAVTEGINTNTATVTGSFNEVPYESDPSDATYATTNVTIAKSAAQSTFTTAGDVLNYSYLVTNGGFAPLEGPVTVSDDKTSVTCPAVNTAGDLDNFLEPGESITCAATYSVISSDVTAGFVTNIASATVEGVTSVTDSVTVVSTSSADLAMVKTLTTSGPFSAGQTLTYSLTVANAGPSTATSVQITDTPTNLTITGVSGGGCVALPCTITSIASGANVVVTVTATITAAGAFDNSASVSGAEPDPDPSNNTDDSDNGGSTGTASADLSLSKTVSNATPDLNSNVTFTVTLSNAGPDNATNVVVTDQLPAGLTLVSATPSAGAYNPVTGAWSLASVGSGTSATLQLVTTVVSTSSITNIAEVTASDLPDPDSTPNNGDPAEDDQASVTIRTGAADLSLTKTVDDATPALGDNVTFTLTLSNAGPDNATNVAVRDLLPDGLFFLGSNATPGTFTPFTGVWLIPVLTAGSSISLEIEAAVNSSAEITNVAEVIAADQHDPDSTPGNGDPSEDDQAAVTLRVASADLSLAKTVAGSSPVLGSNVTFTITLTNDGPGEATGVIVRDVLPSGLVFVSATASSGIYDSQSGLWTVIRVAAGSSHTLQIVVRIVSGTSIINVAEIMASDQNDPDSTPGNENVDEDDLSSVTLTVAEVVNVPTVTEIGLLILVMLLGLAGVFTIRN